MKLLFIFGTRPELIKLAPVITRCGSYNITSFCCSTGQHTDMLEEVINFFNIKIDYNLNVMRHGQSLADLGSRILKELPAVIQSLKPDFVVVHGDTITTFYASLCAYYHKIPIAYIESGLRSHNMLEPFPEEKNRVMTARLATYNFAPTMIAVNNLISEGILGETIIETGNTVIDAIELAKEKIKLPAKSHKSGIKRILVTMHRRENLPEGLISVCQAINKLVESHTDLEFIIPAHKNPVIREILRTQLTKSDRVSVCEALSYGEMIKTLCSTWLVLTDSGGLQEEVPSFEVPVLVLRNTTERPEGIKLGIARLVGTETHKIYDEITNLKNNSANYEKMINHINPYGDGFASDRILSSLINKNKMKNPKTSEVNTI